MLELLELELLELVPDVVEEQVQVEYELELDSLERSFAPDFIPGISKLSQTKGFGLFVCPADGLKLLSLRVDFFTSIES